MTAQSAFVAQIVEGFARGGVRWAVLSPGYRNAPLLLALHRHPALRSVVVVDERMAGFVALGLARSTGQPVVLSCTSGSAPAHYLPALVEARRAGLPLVVLSADRPFELNRVGAPQAVEQRGLFSAHAVYEDELTASWPLDDDIPAGVREPALTRLAVALAHCARGPIHLNLPLRKPLFAHETADPVCFPAVWPAQLAPAPLGVTALQQALERAERPLVVHGATAGLPSAQEGAAIAGLAAQLGAPLVADILAPSRSHNSALPHLDLALSSGALPTQFRPDVVLWFGPAPTSRAIGSWLAECGATIWTVQPHLEWVDPSHRAAGLIQCEPIVLAAELQQVHSKASPDWLGRWQRLARLLAEVVLQHGCREALWDGGAVHAALQAWPGPWAHVGSSLPIRDADALWAGSERETPRIWSNRGANGIDGIIATAWGEVLGTGLPGLAVLGDVSALHDVGVLAHAPSGLPLTVVVVDNGGGQIFGNLPVRSASDFDALFLTPGRANLVELAKAAGWRTERVLDRTSLMQCVLHAYEQPGPHLILAQAPAETSRGIRADIAQHVAKHLAEAL